LTLDGCRLSYRKALRIAAAIAAHSLGHDALSKSTVSRTRTLNSTRLTLEFKDEFPTTVSFMLLVAN